MADLTALIERLEKADGPDRELDELIRCALLAEPGAYVEKSQFNGEWCIYKGEWAGRPKLYERPRSVPRELWDGSLTASIDAAVALAERVLPGRSVMMGWRQASNTKPWARVGLWPDPDATGATPALALVTATLRALSAQEGSK